MAELMFTKWQKIRLVGATATLALLSFGAVAQASYDSNRQVNIEKVVDQKDLLHESLKESMLTPQGGGICDGCYVRFIDTHGK